MTNPWLDPERPNPALDDSLLYDVEEMAKIARNNHLYFDKRVKAVKGGGWGGGDNYLSVMETARTHYTHLNEIILALRKIPTPLERAHYYAWYSPMRLGSGGLGGNAAYWLREMEGIEPGSEELARDYNEIMAKDRPERIVIDELA